MQKILLLVAVIAIPLLALSQQPSKEQIQAQKQEAMRYARAQVADLEKDIATAKENKDDPESIKAMEDQLVLLKKMLATLEKIDPSGPPKVNRQPVAKEVIRKYQSPIIPIALTKSFVAPTESQAKDRLLWYKGKKLDDTTLVTTQAMVVRYSRRRNWVIVRPEQQRDTPILSLVKTLSKTEQIKSDFTTKFAREMNGFLMYPEIIKAYQEFDYIKDRYNEIASNKIDLNTTGGQVALSRHSPMRIEVGASFNAMEFGEQFTPVDLQALYQHLKDLLQQNPPKTFPPPPKRPSDLCLCDPQIRRRYEAEIRSWNKKFIEYENDLLETVYAIESYLSANSGPAANNASQFPDLQSDIDAAVSRAISRQDEKIVMLINQYLGKLEYEETVVQAILAAARLSQKLGFEESAATAMRKARDFLRNDGFEQYIDDKMIQRNYVVVFDYSLYLSHEFHRQVFGLTVDANTGFFDWRKRLEKFNRFVLNIDLDFELHMKTDDDEPMLMATGIIKLDPRRNAIATSSSKVLVSLGRLHCKWQLFLTETNYATGNEIDFRLPMKVMSGVKRVKEEKGVWKDYPYSGPTSMLMVFPSIRLDFCSSGSVDSAVMDVLRYEDGLNVPNLNLQNSNFAEGSHQDPSFHYATDMLAYANLMLVEVGKTKSNADPLVDLANEMQNVRTSQHVDEPTGTSILDQAQIEYSVNLQQHEKQLKLSKLSKVNGTVVTFNAQNGSQLLIEDTYDTAHKELAFDLIRGKIHISVKHDPLNWQLPVNRQ